MNERHGSKIVVQKTKNAKLMTGKQWRET